MPYLKLGYGIFLYGSPFYEQIVNGILTNFEKKSILVIYYKDWSDNR